MPGSVSDSFDPEFSTTSNCGDVADAIRGVVAKISAEALGGSPLKDIVAVVHGRAGSKAPLKLTEREWRIIRFACNRALEEL